MNDIRIPLCEGETLDLGSFVLTEKNGDKYSFSGLETDFDKLPKVQAIGTGSSALCVDTGAFYMYEKSTKTWYSL